MNITSPVFKDRRKKRKISVSRAQGFRFAGELKSSGKGSVSFGKGSSSLFTSEKDGLHAGSMIGESSSMRSIYSLIKRVGKTPTSVLITGESGTGKELVARAVHNAGMGNASGVTPPFVPINCGALPAGLMESELFGHEKGAFTGASVRKRGKVELARGGTLFLDEIATLPLHLQVKLLRFLQERTISRVGGNAIINVDIRVIAATNINLREAVKKGEFREDLYYRLNVVPIEVPPLRERGEDIGRLARHFLGYYSNKYFRTLSGISPEAAAALCAYSWPGNVRELENIMERLVVLSPDDGPINLSDLPSEILSATPSAAPEAPKESTKNFKEALKSFERTYITSLLDKTGWNRARTARLMNVHRNTLLLKMRALEIRDC